MPPIKETAPISAIIATCNEKEYMLEECLRSVVEQTLLPSEIWVVDDGSNPVTADRVVELVSRESGVIIQYHYKENGGLSSSRNRGIQLAKYEYIAFHDADDRWLPNHLEDKYHRLKDKDESFSTAYNGFVEFDDATGKALPTVATGNYEGPIVAEMLGVPNGVPPGQPYLLHRKRALEAVGGFDESVKMSQDFHLMFRLAKAGYQVCGSGVPTYWRRVHSGSHTRKDVRKSLVEMDKFITKCEDEGLITAAYAAHRRKSLRLTMGKRQVLNGDSVDAGVETLREAFTFESPRGATEWLVYFATRCVPLARLGFKVFSRMRR